MTTITGALARAALVAALTAPLAVHAQSDTAARVLELEDGKRIDYTLRTYTADAHLVRPKTALAPTSALDSAKLLNLHLSTGDIEEAALLSNSPRRRFEVLQDYRRSIGDDEFRRVFAQYLAPENRLIAEIAIERHRLLIWDLRQIATAPASTSAPPGSHLAGQYFVQVDDGRYLVDDIPNATRTSLRQVLEAYRAGKIAR